MRYAAAIPVVLLLLILDLLMLAASALLLFIPYFVLISDGDLPLSYKFVKGVWEI